jgi:hypothetical protein
MTPEVELAIGGAVGTFAKIVMMSGGITGRLATLAAVLFTTLTFFVWGYSHNDFSRATTWAYFVAWLNVNAIAAGAFHGTEQIVARVQRDS